MNARELMAAADKISGAHTGMDSQQIQEIFHSLTVERMKAKYLLDLLKETNDSKVRAETKRSLSILGTREPHLKGMINQALGSEKIVYRDVGKPTPPKKGNIQWE